MTPQSFAILGGPGIGDHNDDGTVDGDDFAEFPACMTGPGGGPVASGCAVFDFDDNSKIDLLDFAAFQQIFSL